MNKLPIDLTKWKSTIKYRRLYKVQRKLEVDIILLTEAQINPELLDRKYNIPKTFFADEAHISRMSNN